MTNSRTGEVFSILLHQSSGVRTQFKHSEMQVLFLLERADKTSCCRAVSHTQTCSACALFVRVLAGYTHTHTVYRLTVHCIDCSVFLAIFCKIDYFTHLCARLRAAYLCCLSSADKMHVYSD